MEYKKGDDWIIEMFGAWVICVCCKIMVLAKGLSNRDITRVHTDPERLFEDLKRKNIPSIIRIKLRYIQQDAIYGVLIISCSNI